MKTKTSIGEYLLLALVFLALGYGYLYPGLDPLLEGRTDQAMSDGTDPVTLPFQYSLVEQVAQNSIFDLFYGAVPNRIFDAPEGAALWMSWGEKFLSLLLAPLTSPEQRGTAVVWVLLMLNGLAFFTMGRALRWPKPLSFALALCWAFNPFTHARAKVHMAMVSLYHLPLIFLGLILLRKYPNRKGVFLAALCFIGSTFTLHYFLILTVCFIPFFLGFYFLPEAVRKNARQAGLYLLAAALPAVLLLGWQLTHPLPGKMLAEKNQALPKTGDAKNELGVHPFLITYATRPIDYLGGDTGLGTRDLNPLRSQITAHILKNLDGSNRHERANGIRWWILALVGVVLIIIAKPSSRKSLPFELKSFYTLFLVFAAWAFFLSLSPVWFGKAVGPSAWVHHFVPQIRVASRAGVFVHFAALVLAGVFLKAWLFHGESSHPRLQSKRWQKVLRFPLTLPLLAILSFPPALNPMPLSEIQPAYVSLQNRSAEACGTGMYFPYVSGNFAPLEFYYFIQRLRGASCPFINSTEAGDRNTLMLRTYPLHPEFLKVLDSENVKSHFQNFVRCTGLQWVAFDRRVPVSWRRQFCQSQGWQMSEADICVAPFPHQKLKQKPELCL